MKKFILTVSAVVALATAGYSQVNTNANWVESPVVSLFTQSNFLCGTFVMHDLTDKSWGGGVFAGYKLSEYIVPILRADYVRDSVFAVSGNIQLQLPIHLFVREGRPNGLLTITPFAFAGVATSMNNDSTTDNGNPIGIFGTGGAIGLGSATAWYVPKFIAADYERWTGAGFNDNQVRVGLGWKF